jgi:aspartate ammonia-lyase
VFEPVIAYRLLGGLDMLTTRATCCASGAWGASRPTPTGCARSSSTRSASSPRSSRSIGYERATEVAADALATGRGVYELVTERGLMSREALDRVLDPGTMVGGG